MSNSEESVVFRPMHVQIKINKRGETLPDDRPLFWESYDDIERADKFDVYLFEDQIYVIPGSASGNVDWTNIGVAAGGGLFGVVTGTVAGLASAAVNAARNTAEKWEPLSREQLQIATENGDAICIEVNQSECVAEESRMTWNVFGGTWITSCTFRGKFELKSEVMEGDVNMPLGNGRARSSEFLKSLKNLGIQYSVVRG